LLSLSWFISSSENWSAIGCNFLKSFITHFSVGVSEPFAIALVLSLRCRATVALPIQVPGVAGLSLRIAPAIAAPSQGADMIPMDVGVRQPV
jgi:hypothetical protein